MRFTLWLGLVATAAVGGYLVGKGGVSTLAAREAGQTASSRAGAARVHPAKNPSGAHAVATSTSRQRQRQHHQSLYAALERLRNPSELALRSADPFGDGASLDLDQSRDLAMIFQAEAGDFPGILEFSFHTDEDGTRIWNSAILHPMIRRWCDFSPEQALDWVRSNGIATVGDALLDRGDWSEMELQQIIAEESLAERPEWALALVEDMLTKVKQPAPAPDLEPDPFGPNSPYSSNYRTTEFLYQFTKAHPARAVALLQEASGDLIELGFEGWAAAMIELGRSSEVQPALAHFPEDLRNGLHNEFIETLLEIEPKAARELIEAGAGDSELKMARLILEETGSAAALEWFMNRATEADRGDRVAMAVSGGFIPEFEERVAWVDRMTNEGVASAPAYELLVEQAARNDRFEQAYDLLGRLPTGERTQALAEIFEEEIESMRLWIKGASADLHQASDAARARARAAGYEEELLAKVRQQNRSDWGRIVHWLDGLESNWDAIAPQVPPPEPEPEGTESGASIVEY